MKDKYKTGRYMKFFSFICQQNDLKVSFCLRESPCILENKINKTRPPSKDKLDINEAFYNMKTADFADDH